MIAINKAYFYQLLDEYYRKKYKKTNKTKNVCRLSIELDVSPTTIYNFIGGYNFNRGLLESIVKTLNKKGKWTYEKTFRTKEWISRRNERYA